MYYSNGNYEAFAKPRISKKNENKSAYIVGSGLAALSSAFYLVRDGGLKGERIHILEKDPIAGGACDGWDYENVGYVMRGGREMEQHFEVMWDVFRDVPSIEDEKLSVLEEYYWLNKEDPNSSLERVTENRGASANTEDKFGLSQKAQMEILKLFFTPESELEDKRINEYFSDEVFNSNFWIYWRTMFAFQNWHSALEMKRYIKRFIHCVDGLPDFKALKFTRYNQYESMILPLVNYLQSRGVIFHFNTKVENVIFDISKDKKVAKEIIVTVEGKEDKIALTENDLVFITAGGCVENSSIGDQNTAPEYNTELKAGGGWDMWRKIASQDKSFGNPDKFCMNPEETNWVSATATTLDDKIPEYIKKICKRDVITGKVVTGGIVTVKDSNWLLSWTINRQGQFRNQPSDQACVWIYGLFSDKEGNYIKKPMRDCTGVEICMEWLYHMGVPVEQIEDLAKNSCNTVPVMMPYISAFFMPRKNEDRPKVVPNKAVNFAFIGQFCEIPKDTIFTTEYSMRTGMESVYTLLDVDRAVPEVYASTYDVRELLKATVRLRDGKKVSDMDMNFLQRFIFNKALKGIKGTDIELLLKEYNVI